MNEPKKGSNSISEIRSQILASIKSGRMERARRLLIDFPETLLPNTSDGFVRAGGSVEGTNAHLSLNMSFFDEVLKSVPETVHDVLSKDEGSLFKEMESWLPMNQIFDSDKFGQVTLSKADSISNSRYHECAKLSVTGNIVENSKIMGVSFSSVCLLSKWLEIRPMDFNGFESLLKIKMGQNPEKEYMIKLLQRMTSPLLRGSPEENDQKVAFLLNTFGEKGFILDDSTAAMVCKADFVESAKMLDIYLNGGMTELMNKSFYSYIHKSELWMKCVSMGSSDILLLALNKGWLSKDKVKCLDVAAIPENVKSIVESIIFNEDSAKKEHIRKSKRI